MSELAGSLTDTAKRVLLGRPVRSDHLGHTLLPKRIALPVFASDALSSVAYAPDEILLTLALAGFAATAVSPWIGIAVVVVLVTVVASYRQNVRAYPSGGGDYEVATTNLGPSAGLGVASALMVDYVLTVAVSISSGTQYAASAIPALRGHEVPFAVIVVILLAIVNLRGVKESGKFFAVPVYLFMFAIGGTAVVGFARLLFTGGLPDAESAGFDIVASPQLDSGLTGLAGAFLVARAFASGCAALTGVEAISNGVPAFRKPKSRNAATTLALLGGISAVMIMSILLLARDIGVHYVEDPATQLTHAGQPLPEDYVQHPVIGQIAQSVFSGLPVAFYVVAAATGVILVLAANTAFNGFPVLGSILAKDGYLPRQLDTRGDRLAFSNGIVLLAGGAIVLIVAFDATVTRLIQLYIVGVFVSFTLSQLGMVRHWTRGLRTEADPDARKRMLRSRAVNAFGFLLTGVVLIIVLATKFTRGAWIAIVAMAVLFVLMRAIRRHYDRVARELALGDDPASARALPSRVHAIVLVSKLHKPAMRAIAYARASRPSVLEAVTVGVHAEEVAALTDAWDRLELPLPLRVLDSPFREITRPVLQYVRSIRRESPRDLVVVYIPEYVVGHWWEQILHNQSALRLKGRLLFTPGVVVASVPWQLESIEGQTGLESTRVAPTWIHRV
ncbi:APC family permease [Luteimicrobium subarcticum]|uniref:Amino acid/polyamine/organocation transporter (APC superfamily) n=1 Tax=Luteimicrobium subarcticum TaxID=620910 RepID=A0A2M8W468_9MICO|nr:APC family permease [Luteimicrobium subarcticum]PJI85699.1 amino acid/polyamine/organocation transporter (APC superfamily) [Luteimicrobium subarcticum]